MLSSPRVRPALRFVGAVVASACIALAAHSRAEFSAGDALLAVTSADPMDYAAVTRRIGDQALLDTLLAEDTGAELMLAALRAAPYARAPELLLEAVVAQAMGTDPALAPGALRSAAQIAERIEYDTMEARESDPAVLEPPRERLMELAEDEAARADLRQLALDVATRLAALQREPTE